jgi:lipopolysaccharide export LptBFGC system permease protein LptF
VKLLRFKRIALTALLSLFLSNVVDAKCNQQQRASANEALSMFREMGTWHESGNTVKFIWGNDWDIMKEKDRLKMLHIFADTDACLKGEAREIYFYRNNKLVGEATPTQGVKRIKVDSKDLEAGRQKKINSQFSIWNGSHINLEREIKDSMHDPNSYQHIKTGYYDKGDYLIVTTTFRGKNAFGALIKNTVKAKVNLEGH